MRKTGGMRSGAQALVESLERAGTEIVFGYPGGNVVDIFDRIRTAKFKFVLGRHEQGCTHMADGYARATGRPGVVVVTSGPGATNAITGLATANVDGVPLVLISGQVPLSQIGTDAFQEADMTGICRAATKHSFLVKSADEIPETVAQAFYIATHGKPGAVVIDVPRNVQEELTVARYPERISLRAYHPEHAVSVAQVRRFAKLLNAAKRPVLYAGGGVIAANASADLAALARRTHAPVAMTLTGLGALPGNDPLALGMAGLYGTAAANRALAEADLVVALGVRFNDRVTGPDAASYGRGKTLIQVDCDPSSIEKNVPVDLGIVADVKDLLTTVLSRIHPNGRTAWVKQVVGWKRQRPTSRHSAGGVLEPSSVIRALAAAVPETAVVVTDVGQHQMWCAQAFRQVLPRHFLCSGGMGTMGFAIPAAIGAALANPGEKVLAVVGDGGAQMTFEELIVAAEERLPIVFAVINNSSLGLVRQMQDEGFAHRRFATSIASPDFVMLARAFGIRGERVAEPKALAKVLAKAMRMKGPMLVEFKVNPEANV